MRVLIAFNDYLKSGGERQSVATEYEALSRAGVSVKLFGVDNAALAGSGLVRTGRQVIGDPKTSAEFSATLEDFAPDLVHAENLFPRLGAGVINAIRDAGLPWVRTFRNYRRTCAVGSNRRNGEPCHACGNFGSGVPAVVFGCYRDSRVASVGAVTQLALDQRAESKYLPSAYISISDHLREELSPVLPPEVPHHVVPNAALDVDFSLRPWDARHYDAVFAGRLDENKGVFTDVEMARRCPDLRFAIAGEGPLKQTLVSSLPANVDYLGVLTSSEIRSLFDQSKVALVPSLWPEPFGRVSIEAQQCGCIPMVAAMGGLPETVPPSVAELLVTRETSPDSWVRSLRAILDMDGDTIRRLQAEIAANWDRRFSATALSRSLTEVYASVIRDSRS